MSSVILAALMIVDKIATYSLKLGKAIKLSLIAYGDSNLPLCICFTKAVQANQGAELNQTTERRSYSYSSGQEEIDELGQSLRGKLNPMWITGFTDAEGCFSVIIEVTESLKCKVRVSF